MHWPQDLGQSEDCLICCGSSVHNNGADPEDRVHPGSNPIEHIDHFEFEAGTPDATLDSATVGFTEIMKPGELTMSDTLQLVDLGRRGKCRKTKNAV
jgi:hypothetical protein